jgi:proton-translocating NADH-quinone oxidoreductase chain L
MNNPETAWLIAIYPLLSAVLIMFFIHKDRALSALLSISAVLLSLIHSVSLFSGFESKEAREVNFHWIQVGDFHLEMGYLVDNLSIIMMLTVCFVSFLVQIYTHSYMEEDKGYSRFYSYLSLFTFSMLGLVLSTNLFQMYFFWELVGLCSFLLIGFWWYKASAAAAAKKAFIVNRIGDAGFLLGILMLYFFTQEFWTSHIELPTLSFIKLKESVEWAIYHNNLELIGWLSLTTIGILIFMGAVAKSAQFPLHVWLPDAMEGPTPISALIHAATMVAAGVYLLARVYPIFNISGSEILSIVAWTGGITAIFSATIALSQNDIKKSLAYSTCSQLGYMVMVVGLGAPAVAIFHLVTHAMFKALLFLGSGSVIMACHHEQDMRQMGGLRKYMPITAITFLIGTLSISGLPFMSGFWSKDMIIAQAYEESKSLFLIATITAVLTAFYMFRIYLKTFEGKYRGHEQPCEQSSSVTLPLIALSIPSIVLGYFGSPFRDFAVLKYINPDFHSHMKLGQSAWEYFLHELNQPFGYLPLLAFVGGSLFAYLIYIKEISFEGIPLNVWVKNKARFLYELSLNKWYCDEIYGYLVSFIMSLFRLSWRVFEKYILEGLFVNGLAWRGSEAIGEILKLSQSGKVQQYVMLMILVPTIAIILAFLIR